MATLCIKVTVNEQQKKKRVSHVFEIIKAYTRGHQFTPVLLFFPGCHLAAGLLFVAFQHFARGITEIGPVFRAEPECPELALIEFFMLGGIDIMLDG